MSHDDLARMLIDAGVPWGQHWVRGGWTGTTELHTHLEDLGASEALLARLRAVETEQRNSADEREREWQRAVEELCARRGQLLSAATPAQRREVADRLAQVVQRLVCWGAE